MHRGPVAGACALALTLTLTLAATDVAAETGPLPRWGLGWLGLAQAPTVRVRLGDWQIGVAARPDDDLSYREQWDDDPFGPSTPDSLRNVPDDDKTESGWVRLDVARRVKSWGNVELPLMLAFAYSWRDERDERRTWVAQYQGYEIWRIEEYRNSYELILALRPTWRIRPWVSLETEIGLRFDWYNFDRSDRRSRPNQEEDDVTFDQGHGKSFTSHGWSSTSGIGLVSLVFWL